ACGIAARNGFRATCARSGSREDAVHSAADSGSRASRSAHWKRPAVQLFADRAATQFDLCRVHGVCGALVPEFREESKFVVGALPAPRSDGGATAVFARGVF